MRGYGFRMYDGTGWRLALRFGLWNAAMLGTWSFTAVSGALLALKVLG
jgi:hypothetical protein